jgi:hypothetical protein
MPGRVEADPHIVLRLVAGERRALRDRVRDACLQVVHPDLQVHHHLLVTRSGGPGRPGIALLSLEIQRVTGPWRPQDYPARFLQAGRPAQEPTVEVRERVGVRRVNVRPGEGQPWHGTGLPAPAGDGQDRFVPAYKGPERLIIILVGSSVS